MKTLLALAALAAVLAVATAPASAASFEEPTADGDLGIACRPWSQVICDACDLVWVTVFGHRCTF